MSTTHPEPQIVVPNDSDPHPAILLRGVRTHNLKNLNLDLPIGKLIVLTGLSGSGKSSLAFETLFAEGQRRFFECQSPAIRRRLTELPRPDVDAVENLPPTLSVSQRKGTGSRRATLATVTEVHDYLRLLFARAGTLHCLNCQSPVSARTPESVIDELLQLPDRTKLMLLAPLVRQKKGTQAEVLERISKNGYVRARVDGELVDVTATLKLAKTKPHDLDAVIDRLILKEGLRPRLTESLHAALREGNGCCIAAIESDGAWSDRLFSTRSACLSCGISYLPVEPRLFSFFSPLGACATCLGVGAVESVPCSEMNSDSGFEETKPQTVLCPDCAGSRLSTLARAVRWRNHNLAEIGRMTVDDAADWFDLQAPANSQGESLEHQLAAARLLPEIQLRLAGLKRIGLGYLTLDRSAETLSGGEHQRSRLAASLSQGLTGVCYVLDEPTAGLHPRDARKLLEVLFELRDSGNTLVVVEHDLETIAAADWVVELGPGAGPHGGEIVVLGTPAEIEADARSITGPFLKRWCDWRSTQSSSQRQTDHDVPLHAVELTDCRLHNLKNATLFFPLGKLICVTGVSGSGKSSLILQCLHPAVKNFLHSTRTGRGTSSRTEMKSWGELSGCDSIGRVVHVDQRPLGRTARSTPATATGLWDFIRPLLSRTSEARLRGFPAKRFSIGEPSGRCPSCKGLGEIAVDLDFLPDLKMRCPDCNGDRFNRATLAAKFKGHSAADLLRLTCREAVELFANLSRLREPLELLCELGLGYLQLGQSAMELSGGEAQRIKLAMELSRGAGQVTDDSRKTLFILDEPSSGLHAADVEFLLAALSKLVAQGHTVLVIEHHPRVLQAATWEVHLGPDAGPRGGEILWSRPTESARRE